MDKLFVQQASKLQNVEISSFVKELLFLFITALWEKMQINPTTYYTYGSKKKWTQTFLYCNYGNKDMLLIQQTSKFQNAEISSFLKGLLLLFITALWKKTQISPTTYYTYGNKKKQTQTFPYCNFGNKKKQTHPDHLLYLWQHQKTDN